MTQPSVPVVTLMQLSSMEPAAARVLIAQDVIALLDAEVIEASTGCYVGRSFVNLPTRSMNEVVEGWLTLEGATACPVCALGATLVATVRRFNELRVEDMDDNLCVQRAPLSRYLEHFFDEKQLDLIEIAFEMDLQPASRDLSAGLSEEEWDRALTFRARHGWDERTGTERTSNFGLEADRTCLRAIFTNMIANYGTFVP